MHLTKTVVGLAALAGFAAAHPGQDVAHEAAERRAFLQTAKRASVAHCADKLRARGIEARNVARREAAVQKARQKRALKKRDFTSDLETSHNKTTAGYTVNTDAATLFAGYNSCLLTPEVTQGPYYVAGEYIRENLVEDQAGVSLLLDYQVIDVSTCDPVPNVYVEMWHCNATGVYSGVIASGNGNNADSTNIDKTFLRGIQQTSSDGVAQFESIFPGHYTGRAVHIHVLVHTNATVRANGTLGLDTYASHVGQAFFDQDLIAAVSEVAPYIGNTQTLTDNADDSIAAQEAATEGVDPFMEYTLLGDSVEDGLFAWIAFGVNSTASSSVSPAVFLYEDGGVANPDSNMGGGPAGGPGGNFTGIPSGFSGAPSGVQPTGSAQVSVAAVETTLTSVNSDGAVATTSGSSSSSSTSSSSSSSSSSSTSTTSSSAAASKPSAPAKGNPQAGSQSGSQGGSKGGPQGDSKGGSQGGSKGGGNGGSKGGSQGGSGAVGNDKGRGEGH